MAEAIKNYVFNDDKSFVIFNNKYYVVARHLTKIKDFKDGIQVYNNDNFMGNFGILYFKNNRLHIYQNKQEVAYCAIDDNFLPSIKAQLPEITQWTF